MKGEFYKFVKDHEFIMCYKCVKIHCSNCLTEKEEKIHKQKQNYSNEELRNKILVNKMADILDNLNYPVKEIYEKYPEELPTEPEPEDDFRF